MLEAGKTLVADNNYLISLPYELKEIEDQMNQIKRESLQNKKRLNKQNNKGMIYYYTWPMI